MPAYLEVVLGDRTEVVALDGDHLSIGRDPSNDVTISDGTMSRRHAVFARLAAGWSVTDMGSTNGTLVNGDYIDAPQPLFSGDEIQLGDTRLIYHSGDIR